MKGVVVSQFSELQAALRKAGTAYAYALTYFGKTSSEYKTASDNLKDAENKLHNYYKQNSYESC